jgi:FkbH-like protein
MIRSPIYFVADFTIDALARQIEHTVLPGTETRTATGSVMASLAQGPPGPEWRAVVWTRPDAVSASLARALAFDTVKSADVLDETRTYAEALAAFARGTSATFVPAWTLPAWYRGYGPLDRRPGLGIADLLARMNLELAAALSSLPNVFVLDAARWIAAVGPRAWSAKLWYAAKTPFSPAIFDEAAADLAAAIAALEGEARRIIILDLDDVLWGGLVGETGWESLAIGGHDHLGEAFADFQRALKSLTRRGIQLAIVSKNDEAIALEAIDRHPEMVLRRDDFAAWTINWKDKAQNVAELLAGIGLGPQSAVFIDDSRIERARVAAALPDVLVPEWPSDPARYCEALAALRCFDAPFVTDEDQARSAMYAVERERRSARADASSLETWLASLGTTVTSELLSPSNLERAAQLFNKTNQMNLTTRRLSASQLEAWAHEQDHEILAFRAADVFGDSGLTGILGLSFDGSQARIEDFLLSCRVLGRSIEETMLHVAVARARARGAAELVAELRATARNSPCLEFFGRSGFVRAGDTRFVWQTATPYPRPDWVALEDRSGVTAAEG